MFAMTRIMTSPTLQESLRPVDRATAPRERRYRVEKSSGSIGNSVKVSAVTQNLRG